MPHRMTPHGPKEELAFCAFALLAVCLFALMNRPWRGAVAVREVRSRARPSWPFPNAWLDAVSRGMSPFIIGTALSCLIIGATRALCVLRPELATSHRLDSVAKCGAIAMPLAVVFVTTIALFNWPKVLVARELRAEPGLITVGIRAVARFVRRGPEP